MSDAAWNDDDGEFEIRPLTPEEQRRCEKRAPFIYGVPLADEQDPALQAALIALETAILHRCKDSREQCLALIRGLTGMIMRSPHLPSPRCFLATQPFRPLEDLEDLRSIVLMYVVDPDYQNSRLPYLTDEDDIDPDEYGDYGVEEDGLNGG